MPISDDDLNYLRNINTRPGPNAGKSIDPTKPGPSDKTDKWDREHAKSRVIIQDEKGRFEAIDRTPSPSQDVRVDANVKTVAAVRRAIKEAWLVDGDKTDLDADRLALAAIAALAQPDAGPARLVECPICKGSGFSSYGSGYDAVCGECGGQKYLPEAQSNAGPPPLRYSDKVERAGDGTETRRLELAQPDAEPVRTAPETCPHCFNEEDCGQIELCSALAKGPQSDAEPVESVTFWYRNYRGEISRRVAAILGLRWGSSEYHKEPQWLLRGFDLEKEAEREFAVKDMAPTRDALSHSDAGPVAFAGLIEAAEWPFGYQDTFNLISDATGLVGGNIGISVSKFEKAYNKLRTRAADRSRK